MNSEGANSAVFNLTAWF